jgi:hypothetical protein
VQKFKVQFNSSVVSEFVFTHEEEETAEMIEAGEVLERVLKKMGWSKEDYFNIARLLLIRKDVDLEDFTDAERECFFNIYEGLAEAFKRITPPSQFGFLGGRPHKIPLDKHDQVGDEVRQLTEARIPKPEAYALVARNYKASPATIKRICEDRHGRHGK